VGTLKGVADREFSSPRQLGQILAESSQCQKCIVRQLFRYATGRVEAAEDRRDIDEAAQAFDESGFRFQELMVAVVKTSAFQGEAQPLSLAEAGRAR